MTTKMHPMKTTTGTPKEQIMESKYAFGTDWSLLFLFSFFTFTLKNRERPTTEIEESADGHDQTPLKQKHLISKVIVSIL